MKINLKPFAFPVLGLCTLLVAGSATPAASQVTIQWGRGDKRIEGGRLIMMRSLAHRLDESAQIAAGRARNNPQARSGRLGQRYLWMINDFARQSRSLHGRLDQYSTQPWDVADEIALLNQRAQTINTQIRTSRAFADTYGDWADAQNTLSLMNRALRGQNVAVPAERNGYHPFDERDTFREGRHVQGVDENHPGDGYLSRAQTAEFRALVGTLHTEIDGQIPDRDQYDRNGQSSSELRYFAQRVADLDRADDGDVVNTRDVSALVNRLLADARQYDQSSRGNNAARVDWSEAVRLLEEMAAIVRGA